MECLLGSVPAKFAIYMLNMSLKVCYSWNRLDDSPLEAGLMFTCKLKTDVDFQGRQALEEQKLKGGPMKKKVCLTLDNNK